MVRLSLRFAVTAFYFPFFATRNDTKLLLWKFLARETFRLGVSFCLLSNLIHIVFQWLLQGMLCDSNWNSTGERSTKRQQKDEKETRLSRVMQKRVIVSVGELWEKEKRSQAKRTWRKFSGTIRKSWNKPNRCLSGKQHFLGFCFHNQRNNTEDSQTQSEITESTNPWIYCKSFVSGVACVSAVRVFKAVKLRIPEKKKIGDWESGLSDARTTRGDYRCEKIIVIGQWGSQEWEAGRLL